MAYAQTGQYVFRQTTGNSFFVTAVSASAAIKIKAGQSFKFTHMGASSGTASEAAPVYIKWGNTGMSVSVPTFNGTAQGGDVLLPGIITVLSRPVGSDYADGYIAFITPSTAVSQYIVVTPGEGE